MEYLKLKEVADYSELRTNHITIENYITTENMLPNIGGICLTNSIPDCKTAKYYEEHDILLSNIRPYFCKIWYANKYGSASNDILVIKNKKSINSKFLYYVLCDKNFFNYATATSKGTKMPRGTPNAIMNYFVPNVDIKTQNKIASILSAYDDLIEKNNRRMEILRGSAEELYKEWFVRFRFPNHQNTKFINGIPQGWEIKRLGEVAKIKAGGDAPQEYSKVKNDKFQYPIFSNGMSENGLYGYTDKPTITQESITISARGTVGFVCLRTEPYLPIVRLLVIIPNMEIVSNAFLFMYLKHNTTNGYGTSQQQITVPYFKKKKILSPTKELINKYTEFNKPLYEMILKLQNQNELLKQQRDLLLPRLMSGKINVTP